jgi:hypothetical protein
VAILLLTLGIGASAAIFQLIRVPFNALHITGTGHFAVLPGVWTRQPAVLRLETLSDCKLVSRRSPILSR